MRASMLLILALCSGLAFASGSIAERYKIDPDHTSIVFKINHFGFSNVYGMAPGGEGEFTLDDAHPANSKFQIRVKVAKLTTMVQKRDEHLRSPDFFNEKQFPEITFKSTSIKKIADRQYQMTGDLTIHGHTKPVTVVFHRFNTGKDPMGHMRTGGETSFHVKRSDFGMDFMKGMLGDEVDLMVSLEGQRQ